MFGFEDEDDVRVTSKDEALGELSDLRSEGGTGNSKYHPTFEKCEEAVETEADALVIERIEGEPISDTQVSGLRDYLSRHRPDKYVVRSHRMDADGEEYKVVVFLDTSDEE
jgi:hypothetical protein